MGGGGGQGQGQKHPISVPSPVPLDEFALFSRTLSKRFSEFIRKSSLKVEKNNLTFEVLKSVISQGTYTFSVFHTMALNSCPPEWRERT